VNTWGASADAALGQQPALVGEDGLQQRLAALQAVGPDHAAVMDAAHAQGVEVLVSAVGRDPLAPVGQHAAGVPGVVVVGGRRLPLADIVAQHGLGVGRAHDDGVAVGEPGVGRVAVERRGGRVHGRPQGVGLQPQQQVEDLGVGLGADVSGLGLEGVGRPGLQAPVLVIEEDAAILDRRRAEAPGPGGDVKPVATRRRHVGPPAPGRDADGARQLVDAIGRPTPVGTDDDQGAGNAGRGPVDHGDDEALPRALEVLDVELAGRHQPVDGGVGPGFRSRPGGRSEDVASPCWRMAGARPATAARSSARPWAARPTTGASAGLTTRSATASGATSGKAPEAGRSRIQGEGVAARTAEAQRPATRSVAIRAIDASKSASHAACANYFTK
jgi:hypothetical protein